MPFVNARPIELILQDTAERVDILVTDVDGNPVDATALSLIVANLSGTILLTTEFLPVLSAEQRIFKIAGAVGQYYVLWGDPAASTNIPTLTETANAEDILFRWRVQVGAGNEAVYQIQVVRVVTARMLAMLPGFRLRIDKTAKVVSEDPTDPCFLGYTDSMLMEFLLGGLSHINAYQPYPLWCTLDEFPGVHLELLYESALYVGVSSQELFAIDTDIESWNDQGNSFVVNHAAKLEAFKASLLQHLNDLGPSMKRHSVAIGTARSQINGSYRFWSVVTGAQVGTAFRGIAFGG